MLPDLFFSQAFGISHECVEDYGAFNISLFNDLPLFIDPFLLFNSDKEEYQRIHDQMIAYLCHLKSMAQRGPFNAAAAKSLFCFPEIKQNWMGFSLSENSGRGLGLHFAKNLWQGFQGFLTTFGQETITEGSHIEKLCIVQKGIGRDFISDFSTNMALEFLAGYTETFTKEHIAAAKTRRIRLRCVFNFSTDTWQQREFVLPWHNEDFVLLTPRDILTKDETWINANDLYKQFTNVLDAHPNDVLREQINAYFHKHFEGLRKHPTEEQHDRAVADTLRRWPDLIDHYIRSKEVDGHKAVSVADEKVKATNIVFVKNVQELIDHSLVPGGFTSLPLNTHQEALVRLLFLKDVIENKGGHRFFWVDGTPIHRESDLQILYRFTWIGTQADISREVNDGRGPVDFAVSAGGQDKTLVEFKLAKSSKLKKNLENQCGVYERASDSTHPSLKAIFFFDQAQEARARKILNELGLQDDPNVILIDARQDNKPSGSNAE